MFDDIFLFVTDSLVFDNSFSWTRGKKVYYEGEVVCVDDEYVRSEINKLVDVGDWATLEEKFETTHFWIIPTTYIRSSVH